MAAVGEAGESLLLPLCSTTTSGAGLAEDSVVDAGGVGLSTTGGATIDGSVHGFGIFVVMLGCAQMDSMVRVQK